MKRIIYIALAALAMLATSACQQLEEINDRLDDHEDRIAALEEQCRKLTSNIEALQTITTALQQNDYVTKITCIEENGQEIGYRMTFAKSGEVTVYNSIADGTTPQFKISEGYWYASFDDGATWHQLGKVGAESGPEPLFSDVSYDEDFVYLTLADGDVITIMRADSTQEKLDFLNFLHSCEIADKMVHFSCDDTYACLHDITLNAAIYTSIFENSFFASLKKCHEETGACFTLMTFNTHTQVPDYDISNVPTKFQTEFKECKSWLRFGFHAENEKTNYATATGILESYNKFVSAIYKLSGDYDCIDTITRLGFFSGSLENVLKIKNADHGIIGLLTADDTRTSYYLSHEESETARLKGKYYDLDNRLVMIKTLNRSWTKAKEEWANNPAYHKLSEFFWHEYEDASNVRPWVTTAANLCNEAGYIHGFPSDLYKPVLSAQLPSDNSSSAIDLFVFAGQSNMMGAAHLPPTENPITTDALEYKYSPILKGDTKGEFVYAQHPAGDWYYIDPETAYGPNYLDEATGKSKLTNYSTNTYFVPACRDQEKGFSAQSEWDHYTSPSMPPYFAKYYWQLGHSCIYAHIAKGACNILHYFTKDAMQEYNRLISDYNVANGTAWATLTESNLTGGGEAFDAKVNAMFRDYAEIEPNKTIANKCFVWLQGESDVHEYARYKLRLQALWKHLQSLGFTHFFILRVGFWGSTSVINEIKAQTDFCEENENCYIITRAPSLVPHPSANTNNWWIAEPSYEYSDCRDSYISSTSNQHFNEKAHKIFAKRSAENIHRILYLGLPPILEEENIKGMENY